MTIATILYLAAWVALCVACATYAAQCPPKRRSEDD